MLADPLVVTSDWSTITADAGENWSIPAIERAADHSRYQTELVTGNGTLGIFIGHQYGRRNRFTFRVDAAAVIPDVFVDNNNSKATQSCYVVFDAPSIGAFDYPDYSSGLHLPQTMMKMVGGALISVDTADPLFLRVLNGET
jgi:hypothetical protein